MTAAAVIVGKVGVSDSDPVPSLKGPATLFYNNLTTAQYEQLGAMFDQWADA